VIYHNESLHRPSFLLSSMTYQTQIFSRQVRTAQEYTTNRPPYLTYKPTISSPTFTTTQSGCFKISCSVGTCKVAIFLCACFFEVADCLEETETALVVRERLFFLNALSWSLRAPSCKPTTLSDSTGLWFC